MEAKVISLQTGRVQHYGDANKTTFFEKAWQSGFLKEPCEGKVHVGFMGLEGDEVADRLHHGGIHKALFANSYENYPHWAEFLALPSLPYGALGENLTLSGLHESSVMLGDIHTIGSAILQVSQPRKPCWKISRRWNHPTFTHEIFTSGLSGWYYTVLREGELQAGESVSVQRGRGDAISIWEANEAFKEPNLHAKTLEAILNIPSLAPSYYESIEKRLRNESDLGYMKVE
ncbi:MOSC domain-containing protein [Sulfurospirillum deleyianum]|uniref:MOSC domain containing protein n=1 Tax=Sulfurospirillum deleyianum (strain ATCC 51133 / DSM 6946 / 5175) TaxID=525898 RepID=D1B0S4_SULD5|nr:MOSC domain-containing protein [Sulfurospirillum deleyianum]ACZ11068.1 MOSC domain containing protein [Sulfurospirillum deleyianum DSM 6946]